jgi:type IV secretion system protein TrbL
MLRLLPILALFAIVFAGAAKAQTADGAVDQILHLYRDHAGAWQSALRSLALRLFWLLAGIEFTWNGIKLALKGADISEFTAELVNQCLFIGFGLTLLSQSANWATAIVDSFREAGNQAVLASGGSANLSPTDIFNTGLTLAGKVVNQASLFHPGDTAGLVIAALLILVSFALITAFMVMALVESYVVISAGVLMMGFGGSRWTRDYAFKVMIYAVSIGAKLFILQLLIGLGETMIDGWVTTDQTTLSQIFVMVGAAIILLVITRTVPEMVQGLINGATFHAHGGLIGAASSMAAGFAGGLIGSAAAVHGATALASEQLSAPGTDGNGPQSKLGRIVSHTGATVKNLGTAAASDIGARLGGRAVHGNMPGRMAESLHAKSSIMAADRRKPVAPPKEAGPAEPDNTVTPGEKA